MINNIQILRAIAAINVVIYHTIIDAERYKLQLDYISVLKGWGANGVDIFFVISGFIMVLIQKQRPKTATDFVINRIQRIAPVYWLLSFLMIAVNVLLPSAFNELRISFIHGLSSLLFVSRLFDERYPVVYVGWTLEYEMLFYFIFAITIMLGNFKLTLAATSLTVFVLAMADFSDWIMVEFAFGIAIGYVYYYGPRPPAPVLLAAFGAGLLLLAILIRPDAHRALVSGVPAFLLVLGCVFMPQARNRTLVFLGDASYSIYLVQVFTIPVFYKVAAAVRPDMPTDLIGVACVAFTVAVGAALCVAIEKPLQHWTQRLLMRRSMSQDRRSAGPAA